MKGKITPIDDRLLVKLDDPTSRTKGGVIIPDTAQVKKRRGRVLAVGSGKMLESGERAKPAMEPGDRILFLHFADREVEVDHETLVFVRESDVLLCNNQPVGGTVVILKEADEAVSGGGIIIPEKHQDYKRRGWVVATGGGTTLKNGESVPLQFGVGDYLVADRRFVRQDEDEDELCKDPTLMVIRDDEYIAFIPEADCSGPYARPKNFKRAMKVLSEMTGDEDQGDARGETD